MGASTTGVELAREYEAVTGQRAVYDPLSAVEGLELGREAFGEELAEGMGQMFECVDHLSPLLFFSSLY
jgi:hypothetical protein